MVIKEKKNRCTVESKKRLRNACKWVQKLRMEERSAWQARFGVRVRSNRHILGKEGGPLWG